MNSRERNQAALRQAFEQTLDSRAGFEQLDLQSTKSVVDMLGQAVSLAKDYPQEFFNGFSTTTPSEETVQIKDSVSGGQQQTGERRNTPVDQIENLLDFLKAQKEYWAERDDTGQESIGTRVINQGSGRQPGSEEWEVIVELDPPPGPGDRVEVFDPRTGEKISDMSQVPGELEGVYAGPTTGLGNGDEAQIRVNGVPVTNVSVAGP